MDTSDLTAIRQLKDGDLGGLEHLVHRYQLQAVRLAFLVTRDRGLAEEVVQESFLRLQRSIRGFDESRPFEPWFLRTVLNRALNLIQRARRESPLPDEDAGQVFSRLAARVESPQAQVEAAETEREVQLALEQLSPRQRLVIVQRYFLEMSEAEMANSSGTAPGTIKWLLSAARRRLRSVLPERSDE